MYEFERLSNGRVEIFLRASQMEDDFGPIIQSLVIQFSEFVLPLTSSLNETVYQRPDHRVHFCGVMNCLAFEL